MGARKHQKTGVLEEFRGGKNCWLEMCSLEGENKAGRTDSKTQREAPRHLRKKPCGSWGTKRKEWGPLGNLSLPSRISVPFPIHTAASHRKTLFSQDPSQPLILSPKSTSVKSQVRTHWKGLTCVGRLGLAKGRVIHSLLRAVDLLCTRTHESFFIVICILISHFFFNSPHLRHT